MRGCTRTSSVIPLYMIMSRHDHVAKMYAAIDFRTSTQVFAREVTPELVKALTP